LAPGVAGACGLVSAPSEAASDFANGRRRALPKETAVFRPAFFRPSFAADLLSFSLTIFSLRHFVLSENE